MERKASPQSDSLDVAEQFEERLVHIVVVAA
jgi:hypothetical protein